MAIGDHASESGVERLSVYVLPHAPDSCYVLRSGKRENECEDGEILVKELAVWVRFLKIRLLVECAQDNRLVAAARRPWN